jgi:ubiquitin carboxyl-terminal hydrolase 6/32
MFLDGRQPIKYGLKLEMDEKYRHLKEELSKLCNLPSSRLLMVEVYASNIRVSGTSEGKGLITVYLG